MCRVHTYIIIAKLYYWLHFLLVNTETGQNFHYYLVEARSKSDNVQEHNGPLAKTQ